MTGGTPPRRISAKSHSRSLKTVIGRHFEYAIAFHGWSEDSVCIGGSAPPDLKNLIKTAIRNAIPDPKIDVITDDEGCPRAFNGNDAKNVVNRLGINGVQIEQWKDARKFYSMQIADAVSDAIGLKVKVCTAPVFDGSNSWTCLMKSIGDSVLVMSRAGVPSIRCEIKRLLFRIRNCRRGNADPCVEL